MLFDCICIMEYTWIIFIHYKYIIEAPLISTFSDTMFPVGNSEVLPTKPSCLAFIVATITSHIPFKLTCMYFEQPEWVKWSFQTLHLVTTWISPLTFINQVFQLVNKQMAHMLCRGTMIHIAHSYRQTLIPIIHVPLIWGWT